MTRVKSLSTGAFVISLLAAPASALDVGASASGAASGSADVGGVSAGAGATASATTSTSIDVDPAAVIAEGDATAQEARQQAEAAAQAAQDMIGDAVTTADAAIAGTIRDVEATTNGMIDVRVSVNSDLGVEPRNVTLRMSANAAASGAIVLPMTAAEFVAQLDATAG